MCVSECVCVRARVFVSERPSIGEEKARKRRWGDSERASETETTGVSERPIAVKKSLRKREHCV